MSEVLQDAEHEFWRAPLGPTQIAAVPSPTSNETCPKCASEFVMGAGFCHACGSARKVENPIAPIRSWTHYFEFQHIKEKLGLPTLVLISFLAGLGCLICTLCVGIVFSAATILDWQAVQLWRIEWLLAAAACFLAGILLRCAPNKQ